MARRSHDESSNSSGEHGRDLNAQFWGSSPAWTTTGRPRRSRRNGDQTGPVARTRRHGDRTGQIPFVPAAQVEEPLIDPLDFGLDGVGYGPAPGIAGRHSETRDPASLRGYGAAPTKAVELIELEERPLRRPGDPVSSLAARLGLGAVDPLLLRLGAIVMVGVLLVPLAVGLRPDSSTHSVRTEPTAAPSTDLIEPGVVPVVEAASPGVVANSGTDSQPALQTAAEASSSPTTSPPAAEIAVAIEQPVTTANVADVAESADGSESDAADSADDTALDVAETLQAPRGTTQPASGGAEADEPANVVAPVCQRSYTVAAGDYWIRIADSAGITLAKLLQTNRATVETPMYPGDDICLPSEATLPTPPTTTIDAPPTTPPVIAPPTTVAPTTTAPPPTTSPVVTAPPAPGVIEAIIREVWPDDIEDKALEIAWRESGHRPGVKNWCCYGLFQIHWTAHRSWLDDVGINSATQLLDARSNVRAAYALYLRSGGWGPWGG